MSKYKAILFHPEGDWVSDCNGCDSKQEVWDEIEDFGSRWIFYPIPMVITDTGVVNQRKTIRDTCEGLEFLKGKSIGLVVNFLNTTWETDKDEICEEFNAGVPLQAIYKHKFDEFQQNYKKKLAGSKPIV